ncbi:hypothetical protein AAFC00_002035 [Neodothiora populina]|uniref:NADH:flavin oxidoreductase/NADH oxidase N-terminal domain-containing protein n=1 Tax=Neodothiora populina TaxID=2781224 RepID=A0ABR3PGC3_9PEZI
MAIKSRLFEPLQVGQMQLSNRLAMAPLTRFRANDEHVHEDMAVEYYAQRASYPGTLLVTEATPVSARVGGYANVPGIYTDAQIRAWKKITDAVHAKGSYIYLQLWSLGRVADPSVLKKETGLPLKSASAVPMDDKSPVPEEYTEEEIWGIVEDFAQGAKNAIEAGFDGVEIHAANGYLIDQFTQDTCNKRTDKWGGSVENRSRFCLEVTKAVVAAVGADKTGIRLSPWSPFQGMKMEDPVPQFSHLTKSLKEFNLAYLHLVESRITGNADVESYEQIDFVTDIWGKTSPILLAGGFKADSAKEAADKQYKDKDIIIVFGRYFIANPDLVFRVREGIEFTDYDRDTFYAPGQTKGYTDYPFSKEFKEAKI